MGNESLVEGSIDIVGDVNYATVAESRFNPDAPDFKPNSVTINYEFEEATVTVAEGVLTRKMLVAIVPAFEFPYKAYDLVSEVQEAIDEITAASEVTFVDYLEVHGEHFEDHWRVRVIDGKAVRVKGRIVYDDPTESPL